MMRPLRNTFGLLLTLCQPVLASWFTVTEMGPTENTTTK